MSRVRKSPRPKEAGAAKPARNKKTTRRSESARKSKTETPTEATPASQRTLTTLPDQAEDIGFSAGIFDAGPAETKARAAVATGPAAGADDAGEDRRAAPRRKRGARRSRRQTSRPAAAPADKTPDDQAPADGEGSRRTTPTDRPRPTAERSRRSTSAKAADKEETRATQTSTKKRRRRTPRTSAAKSARAEAPSDIERRARPPVVADRVDADAPAIDFDESEDQPADVGTQIGDEAKPRPEPTPKPQRAGRRTRDRASTDKTVDAPRAKPEQREMLINVSEGDECRISLLRDGRLEELYIERATATSNVGNIYKGRITNVEPSIQAAFVDFGLPSHGFLHISDLHPKYFPNSKGELELVGKKTPRRERPPIQNALRAGQEVIVQVIKEGIGTKGPTLSSYISLPGRFLVMMPDMSQLGVSRKIEDEDQRRTLRSMLGQLSLPSDTGFIVRTAGVDRTKRDLQRDLNYLTRLWKRVAARIKSEPAPAELYKESDLVIRTIRDVYDSSLKRIIVDSPSVADRVRDFLAIASPRSQDIVTCYEGSEPMFHRFGIESEIEKLHSRRVPLPCGGSLVIEQTEALVAIDVNSGRFRVPENAEETAYRVNLEAVDEIARQLRLRDLGGLIILDLIDMMQEKHKRAVERRMSDALKSHKERAKILRLSRFGILEMTRQRQRPSFAKSVFQDCPRCGGSGIVKAVESMSLDVMRQIRLVSHREGVASIDVRVATAVANDLLNRKRVHLTELERATGQSIRVHGEPNFTVDEVKMSCTDRRGREVPGVSHDAGTSAHADSGKSNDRNDARHGRSRRGGRARRTGRRR